MAGIIRTQKIRNGCFKKYYTYICTNLYIKRSTTPYVCSLSEDHPEEYGADEVSSESEGPHEGDGVDVHPHHLGQVRLGGSHHGHHETVADVGQEGGHDVHAEPLVVLAQAHPNQQIIT